MKNYCEEIEKLIEDLTWIPEGIEETFDVRPTVDNLIELIDENQEIELVSDTDNKLIYAFTDKQNRKYNIEVSYEPIIMQNFSDEITEIMYYRVDVSGFYSKPQPVMIHRFLIGE